MATWFPADPSQPRGGVEAVSVNLVRKLGEKTEFHVDVVTFDNAIDVPKRLSWNNAEIHRLPFGKKRLLRFAVGEGRSRLQEYIASLGADLVHCHDTYGIMARGIGIPRVLTIHGFIYQDTLYQEGRTSKIRSKIWERIEKAAWADQSHIISISPYVRERLNGITGAVIHDIENPIDEECFSLVNEPHGKTVLSAGIICERKNTLGLLEAGRMIVERDPTVKIRIAGEASSASYERKITGFIRSHDLTGNVTLLGRVSSGRLRSELSRAAVFALVSFEEGAPMVIEEAMAARVPVVASNRCGMPYMIRDGETGFLVNPHDGSDIARAIERILTDMQLRTAMGERAHQIAGELFHPAAVARRTGEVYKKAIEDFRRKGSKKQR
ncbi:MAG: glycosyltransferase family 4 protein [Candidatus Latescibacteria bacterium]|nr:glycosyltransferase family 4 protein [Candidatus Latescibacterota bacterium]